MDSISYVLLCVGGFVLVFAMWYLFLRVQDIRRQENYRKSKELQAQRKKFIDKINKINKDIDDKNKKN